MAKHFKGFYNLLQELGSRATISVFYHQCDIDVHGDEQQNEFWTIFTEQLRSEANDEDISNAIDLYSTSIYDHTLTENMSKIMSKMVERQLPTLKKMINEISSVSLADSVLHHG